MGVFNRYVTWTESLLEDRRLLALFVYINIAGAAFGLLTYRWAMEDTSPLLWILLVDCPIYPALMVFLLTFRNNKTVQKLSFLAFYGLIKYGLWTITAWSLNYRDILLHNTVVNGVVFLGHFGMVLEAGFVARNAARARGLEVMLPVAWMFANDFFDYVLGTHPPLPGADCLWLLLAQNMALNVVVPIFLLLVARRELE
jgi:uncharacterized membrane protein YpjA